MTYFDPNRETELITDASSLGIAFKLVQLNPETNKWHPVLYGSKKLTQAERKWTATELECLAVVTALEKNKQYLQGMKFRLVTDHKALKSLLTKKDLPGKLARWSMILTGYPDIEIVHRPGDQISGVRPHVSRASWR